jgi:integrase
VGSVALPGVWVRGGGVEWWTPLHEGARAAIDHALGDPLRRLMRSPYLFPSPRSPRQHVSRDKARRWLLAAERLAELPKLKGGCWHPFRRAFASSMRHLPLQDVMYLGGWTDPTCLQTLYQKPDRADLYQALTDARPVRTVT